MIYDFENKMSSPLLSEFNTNNYEEMLSPQSSDRSLIVFSMSYMLHAMNLKTNKSIRWDYKLSVDRFILKSIT